jgi:hypothetical protein
MNRISLIIIIVWLAAADDFAFWIVWKITHENAPNGMKIQDLAITKT